MSGTDETEFLMGIASAENLVQKQIWSQRESNSRNLAMGAENFEHNR
tara:strand:+ start:404 stop:544 length:141 start_codon:yes stop_codon:yes gene_type:complete